MSSATSARWTSTSATSARRSSATPGTPSSSTPRGASGMFSARKRFSQRKPVLASWRKGSLSSKLRDGFKPHLSMRVWLTALFVLVTALAAISAYWIVRPILEETLDRASEAAFRQVGEQFENQIRRNANQI